jgi:hypothetical protein
MPAVNDAQRRKRRRDKEKTKENSSTIPRKKRGVVRR